MFSKLAVEIGIFVLLVAMLGVSMPSSKAWAGLEELPQRTKMDHLPLVQLAMKVCGVPESTPLHSLLYLERYVGQVVYPEWKMLYVAFLNGFRQRDSRLLKYGPCIGLFMNLPLNKSHEVMVDLKRDAEQLRSVVPLVKFVGFTDNGSIVLEPSIDI